METTTIQIERINGVWQWRAFDRNGDPIHGGDIKTRAKAPPKAQLVRSIPERRVFALGQNWIAPAGSRHPQRWIKVPGRNCYMWEG